MPYIVSLATAEDRDLVVTALRSAADQRTRVARGAARKVAELKAAKRDVRSQAVKVTDLLAEADVLAELANELEAATNVLVVRPAPTDEELDALRAQLAGDNTAVVVPDGEPAEDDGTSPAAQALAAAAGLTDAIVEDGVDTGATTEDEPDGDDVEEVLA